MKILEDPEVFNKIRTINNWWEMRKQSFELQLDIYKYVVNVEYSSKNMYDNIELFVMITSCSV